MGRAGKVEETRKVTTGTVTVGGKTFYARSTWEANVAAYLQYLKESGVILDWEHEPKTFWFEGIKRGVCSYLPDFKITYPDGRHLWLEVKGWLDAKSKTKLKRMKKYFPEEQVELFDGVRYRSIKKMSSLFPEWARLDSLVLDPRLLCTVEGCTNKLKDRGFCSKHYAQIYGTK